MRRSTSQAFLISLRRFREQSFGPCLSLIPLNLSQDFFHRVDLKLHVELAASVCLDVSRVVLDI